MSETGLPLTVHDSDGRAMEPFVLSSQFESGFALDLWVKDLMTALALASRTGTEVPLSRLALAGSGRGPRRRRRSRGTRPLVRGADRLKVGAP